VVYKTFISKVDNISIAEKKVNDCNLSSFFLDVDLVSTGGMLGTSSTHWLPFSYFEKTISHILGRMFVLYGTFCSIHSQAHNISHCEFQLSKLIFSYHALKKNISQEKCCHHFETFSRSMLLHPC
jgi:hypothetical protein